MRMKKYIEEIRHYFVGFDGSNYADLEDFVSYLNREEQAGLCLRVTENKVHWVDERFTDSERSINFKKGNLIYWISNGVGLGCLESLEQFERIVKQHGLKECREEVKSDLKLAPGAVYLGGPKKEKLNKEILLEIESEGKKITIYK